MSATTSEQTRTIASDLDGLLYELEHPEGIVTHNTMRLHKEAATAIASLREERDNLRKANVEISRSSLKVLGEVSSLRERVRVLEGAGNRESTTSQSLR